MQEEGTGVEEEFVLISFWVHKQGQGPRWGFYGNCCIRTSTNQSLFLSLTYIFGTKKFRNFAFSF